MGSTSAKGCGAPQEPQPSSPTHVLGKEETTNFNLFFRVYPGVYGDHRVETAGKRKCRPASGSKEGQSAHPFHPTSLVPQAPPTISPLANEPQPTSPHCPLLHRPPCTDPMFQEQQLTAGSP